MGPLRRMRRRKTVWKQFLWNLIQGISAGARLLESFMPSTSRKILDQLGDGHVTDKPEILFQRLDVEEVLKKVEELHSAAEEAETEEPENVIDIEAKTGDHLRSVRCDAVPGGRGSLPVKK